MTHCTSNVSQKGIEATRRQQHLNHTSSGLDWHPYQTLPQRLHTRSQRRWVFHQAHGQRPNHSRPTHLPTRRPIRKLLPKGRLQLAGRFVRAVLHALRPMRPHMRAEVEDTATSTQRGKGSDMVKEGAVVVDVGGCWPASPESYWHTATYNDTMPFCPKHSCSNGTSGRTRT